MNLGRRKRKSNTVAKSAGPWIVRFARLGYLAKGVVYLVIGLLSAMAAFKARGGRTTGSQGALTEILHQPYGKFSLTVVAIGLIGYAVWCAVQALKDTENKGSSFGGLIERAGFFLAGILHASLSYSAVRLVLGEHLRGEEASHRAWTAMLLAQPFGRWLVAAIGLGIFSFGIHQCYKAVTGKLGDPLIPMRDRIESLANGFGRLGLGARGIVFGIIGVFLMQAALYYNPRRVHGLGGALRVLERQPYGFWLLVAAAIGMMAYGAYMFILAAYRKMTY